MVFPRSCSNQYYHFLFFYVNVIPIGRKPTNKNSATLVANVNVTTRKQEAKEILRNVCLSLSLMRSGRDLQLFEHAHTCRLPTVDLEYFHGSRKPLTCTCFPFNLREVLLTLNSAIVVFDVCTHWAAVFSRPCRLFQKSEALVA